LNWQPEITIATDQEQDFVAPEGFEPLDLGSGFTLTFGRIYVRRADSRLGFRVDQRHLNPMAVCHGGAMATFADMQVAVVKAGLGTRTGHMPTIHLDVDYLATAPAGSWVEMEVTLVKTTRNLVFTQALITANGNICARSAGIYRNAQAAQPLG
jgi:uncharacterized protein (TIGR00369 family)